MTRDEFKAGLRQLPELARLALREMRDHPALLFGALPMRVAGYRWDRDKHRWVDPK